MSLLPYGTLASSEQWAPSSCLWVDIKLYDFNLLILAYNWLVDPLCTTQPRCCQLTTKPIT